MKKAANFRKQSMPILRGHHLICLNFFTGEGYDEAFIKNLSDIINKAKIEGVKTCSGPDDVCIKCPHLKNNECRYDENADEEIKKMDEMALSLLKTAPDTTVSWQEINGKIPEIFAEWYQSFCLDCDWKKVCGKNRFFEILKNRV